jgi:excisionase family DNA binding protein
LLLLEAGAVRPTVVETPAGRIVSGLPPEQCAGLPINAAADYLGVGRTSIYTLLNNGSIKSVRILGRNIVLRSSLDEYI